MFLLAASSRLISFAVAREHFDIHPLARFLLDYAHCVPVTRNGRDAVAARKLVKCLGEGRVVCIFPEGNLSGVTRNHCLSGKHGAAFLALATRAPVFPVYLAGGPRTDRLLESWVIPSPRAVRVTYGPAIDLSAYYGQPRTRRLLEEVTQRLQECILKLRPQKVRRLP
jgi:1-acyl-sn-glycerol-3-phosphate acyltransferase